MREKEEIRLNLCIVRSFNDTHKNVSIDIGSASNDYQYLIDTCRQSLFVAIHSIFIPKHFYCLDCVEYYFCCTAL